MLPQEMSTPVSVRVNGVTHSADVDNRTSLLDFLREGLELTGSKKGCDHGQCGACTVLLNGRRANSCLILAATVDGGEVLSVEGLEQDGELHPLQRAFVAQDGFQCGYCTPGQLCSAIGMMEEVKAGEPSAVTPSNEVAGAAPLPAEEIRERMSGNLCRCGAYSGITAAIQDVASADAAMTVGGAAE